MDTREEGRSAQVVDRRDDGEAVGQEVVAERDATIGRHGLHGPDRARVGERHGQQPYELLRHDDEKPVLFRSVARGGGGSLGSSLDRGARDALVLGPRRLPRGPEAPRREDAQEHSREEKGDRGSHVNLSRM